MMDQEQKATEQQKVVATYDADSKRFHRFVIDGGQGIVGTVYFPKDGEKIPDEITVSLRTRTRGQDDSPGS